MKEFAVWYNKEWTYNYKQKIEHLTLEELMESGYDDYEDFNYYESIGLKDINGKSIYANSSIVEFTASGSHGYTQIKGYFHFLKEDLKYIIKSFTHGSFDFNKKLYKNFKVIDTIQENKLGLIK